jgi:hypothetical protein
LEHHGFITGKALPSNDLPLLAARFFQQLQQLHQDYVETGRKTVLVIDGLDHISREQAPTRSLLRELPQPQQIPEGVYVLLGSQTDQLSDLPSAVRAAITSPVRRLQMRLLSPASVQSIVRRAGLETVPDGQQVSRIYELSGGHPLALGYIVNQLRTHTVADVDQILSEVEPYETHIDVQYVSHWHQVEANRELVHLLALLARIRGAIDMRWVEQWANADALYQLHRTFKHYFRVEAGERWYFFHNSFRAFLMAQTRQLPGVSSVGGDAQLYVELAAHSSNAAEDRQRWDELYYRAAAQDHAAVTRLAEPTRVRAQFLAGRSVQSIRSDIKRAYASVRARSDVVLLTRLCLLASEYNQRESNLEQLPLTDMLLALGDERTAIDRLREGQQLRVSEIEGLRVSSPVKRTVR